MGVSNIKVLYINEWLAKGTWQVQRIHAYRFLEAFQRLPGTEIFTFPQITTSSKEDNQVKSGKQYSDLARKFIKAAAPSFVESFLTERFYAKTTFKIITYINQLQPDLILARHNVNFFRIIRNLVSLKQPLILEVNGILANDLAVTNKKPSRKIAKLERDVILHADASFAVCRATAGIIELIGVSPDKVFVVPNGADPIRFSPRPKSKKLSAEYGLSDHTVIGYVGGFTTDEPDGRDVSGMLKAFKLAKAEAAVPLKMLMVGRMDEEYLLREIKSLGIADSVVFTGFADYLQIPELISLIDITVAPYLENDLAFRSPVKLFEYMAMEKPTIIPRVGQPAEILVDMDSAVLVEPESPVSMAESILILIKDGPLREKIGRNARKLFLEKYTWEHNAQRIEEICRSVLNKQQL